MAAAGRPIFYKDKSGSCDSDSDVETVDPSDDLVVFEDTPKVYAPGEDIFLVYYLGKNSTPSSRDWVGLYPLHWTSTKDYVAYEWAPKFPRDTKHPLVRSVLFSARNLQVEPSHEDFYQFLYITKHSQVIGVSKKFHIHDVDPEPNLVCVDRPITGVSSMTFVESKVETTSLNGFEVLGDNSSSRSASNKSSNYNLSKLFTVAGASREVSSDLALERLFSEESGRHPLRRSPSSDYHLELLFSQSVEGNAPCYDPDVSRYQSLVFAPKPQYTWAQIVQGITDICDSQWDETGNDAGGLEAVVVEPIVKEYEPGDVNRGSDRSVVAVPCKAMVPYTGAGPLVPYQPIFRFREEADEQNTEKEDEERDQDEVLLTAVYTRYFNDPSQNLDIHQIMDVPMVKKLVDLIKDTFRPLANLDLKQFALCSPKTDDAGKPSSAGKRRRRRKQKCSKCAQKNRQMRNLRRQCNAQLALVNNLENVLEETDSELLLRDLVMEDLAKQIKDMTHDTLQLEHMYSEALKDKTSENQHQQDWLQLTVQGLQQENHDLKANRDDLQDQVSNLSKVHVERNNEWHMAASQRYSFHLATIARQEKTIVNLTNERNQLTQQMHEAEKQIDELTFLHKEADDTVRVLSQRLEEIQGEVNLVHRESSKLSIQLELQRRERAEEKLHYLQDRNLLTAQITRLEEELKNYQQVCRDDPLTKKTSSSCQTSFVTSLTTSSSQTPPGAPPSPTLTVLPASSSHGIPYNCDPAVVEVGLCTAAPVAKRAKCLNSAPPTPNSHQSTSWKKDVGSATSNNTVVRSADNTVATPRGNNQEAHPRSSSKSNKLTPSGKNNLTSCSGSKVVKVAARGQAKKCKKDPINSPSTNQTRDFKIKETKKESTSPSTSKFGFFSSGLDFLSSLKSAAGLDDKDSSSDLTPAAFFNVEDGISPVVNEPVNPFDSQIKRFNDWLDQEDQEESEGEAKKEEDWESTIASNWLSDFSASWKPKSGKKREKQPGHVRFAGVEDKGKTPKPTSSKSKNVRHFSGLKRRKQFD